MAPAALKLAFDVKFRSPAQQLSRWLSNYQSIKRLHVAAHAVML